MFKFLKSKKGFTLVELMIVVVIMAILVAVAVPIFSAVTANARKKTCTANQREISAQLNNYAMSQQTTIAGEITIETQDGGDSGEVTDTGSTALSGITTTQFEQLFQEIPYCPIEGAKVVVTIAKSTLASEEDGGIEVTVACDQEDHPGYVASPNP